MWSSHYLELNGGQQMTKIKEYLTLQKFWGGQNYFLLPHFWLSFEVSEDHKHYHG